MQGGGDSSRVCSINHLPCPIIGVGNAVLFILTGQLLSSAMIDHYGLFDLTVSPLTIRKSVGLGCVIAGLVIINNSTSTGTYH